MTASRLRWSRALVLCAVIAGAFAAVLGPIHAQLRGHGGAVRALAISADGLHAISGSFDTSAIRWSLSRNVAEQVMRFHDGPVNAGARGQRPERQWRGVFAGRYCRHQRGI